MIDLEGTICSAIAAQLTTALAAVNPPVQVTQFGGDLDALPRRIEVNAEVTGDPDYTFPESQVYRQNRMANIQVMFITPKMTGSTTDIGVVVSAIRDVIETAYTTTSPANYAMSLKGLTIANPPVQTFMMRREEMVGEFPVLAVMLTYEAQIYYRQLPAD